MAIAKKPDRAATTLELTELIPTTETELAAAKLKSLEAGRGLDRFEQLAKRLCVGDKFAEKLKSFASPARSLLDIENSFRARLDLWRVPTTVQELAEAQRRVGPFGLRPAGVISSDDYVSMIQQRQVDAAIQRKIDDENHAAQAKRIEQAIELAARYGERNGSFGAAATSPDVPATPQDRDLPVREAKVPRRRKPRRGSLDERARDRLMTHVNEHWVVPTKMEVAVAIGARGRRQDLSDPKKLPEFCARYNELAVEFGIGKPISKRTRTKLLSDFRSDFLVADGEGKDRLKSTAKNSHAQRNANAPKEREVS